MLIRLVYCSKLNENVAGQATDIVKTSQAKNEVKGITGTLISDGTYFIQALEGNRTKVMELFQHIASDERHSDVLLVKLCDISERAFYEWNMNLISLTKEQQKKMIRFTESKDFNPYELSGDAIEQLCIDLNQP